MDHDSGSGGDTVHDFNPGEQQQPHEEEEEGTTSIAQAGALDPVLNGYGFSTLLQEMSELGWV